VRQIITSWVCLPAHDFAVHGDERQTSDSLNGQQLVNGGVLDERLRLLGEIEALYPVPQRFQPLKISREAWKHGIDFRATNSRRTAHRLVIDLNGFHVRLLG